MDTRKIKAVLIDKIMNEEKISAIEKVFRSSSSSGELFDAFQDALEYKAGDIELFKILLANPFLSEDEIKLFTGKLVKEFPNEAFDILIWTGEVFVSRREPDHLEEAINYFSKAISMRPGAHQPFLCLINIYNTEYELPLNHIIMEIINIRLEEVNFKSRVYYALADLYRKLKDSVKESKFIALAEKAMEKERI